MIKAVYSAVFCCMCLLGKAQSQLTFSQVLLLENTIGTTSCNTCWTVPAGKVWKVESVGGNTSDLASVLVNGRNMGYITSTSFATSNSSYWGLVFGGPELPFWLPAGASLGYSGIGSSHSLTFFVLEFTVI